MKRNMLNLLLLVVFFLLLAFSFLPNLWHEIIGVFALILMLVHLFINKGWLGSLKKIRWDLVQSSLAIVDFLLMVDFFVVFITGIFLSNQLFREYISMELHRNIMVQQLHVSMSWLLLMFIGLHLGMHGRVLWMKFIRWIHVNTENLYYRISRNFFMVVIIGIGVYASILNQLIDRLMLKHIFGTAASKESGILFGTFLLGIVGMCAIIGGVFVDLLRRIK